MRPDRKLKWFSDRGIDTEKIHKRVVDRFNETYTGAMLNSAHIPRPLQGLNIKVTHFLMLEGGFENLLLFRQAICGHNDTLRLWKER